MVSVFKKKKVSNSSSDTPGWFSLEMKTKPARQTERISNLGRWVGDIN